MVSIIIPVYNGEKKIIKALNSLNSQTCKDYEIIVVNDGSKDKTEKVVLEYAKKNPRIKYFYKENSGVSDTRNYGISRSKGEYIVFLDCDDYFDSKWIEKMTNKMQKDQSDLCYCGYNTFCLEQVNRIKTKFKKHKMLKYYLLGKVKLQTACFLIKREIIQKNALNFRINCDWGEDFEFFCKVLKNSKKITYLKEHLTYYNIEDTKDKLSKFDIEQLKKNKEMIENIQKEIDLNKEEEIALINYLAPAMIVNFIYKNRNKIKKEIIKDIISNNIKDIKNMKFVNGLRSVKIFILLQMVKIEVLK